MANEKHAVVRLDKMTGTRDESKLISARFYADNKPAEIENGNVVHITGTLVDRDVFKTEAPKATDTKATIGLVASVELVKDSCTVTSVDEFTNKADGEPQRVYLLETGCIFSVTKEAINGENIAKGGYVKVGTTTKWEYTATETGAVGQIIDIEKHGRFTWYVICVK